MKTSRQVTALHMWNALPHALLWLSLLCMCILFGYSALFANLIPALPLIFALILAWDHPPPSLRFSLLFAGVLYDMLVGLPLGFTGLTWLCIYMLHRRRNFDVEDDEPFFTRFLLIMLWLAAYVVLEYIFGLLLNLHRPPLTSLLLRFVLMACLTPLAAWLIMLARKTTYRKLWVFLPHEVKPL